MVTEESYNPYMRPPLSKELWFKGADAENLSFNDWAGKTKKYDVHLYKFAHIYFVLQSHEGYFLECWYIWILIEHIDIEHIRKIW